MTTALPSVALFIYDKYAIGDFDFYNSTELQACIDNPSLYDKVFTDIGPRGFGGPYRLEWANLWHTTGQTASLVSLADAYEELVGLGKEIWHYLGGIHASTNEAFWDAKVFPARSSAGRLILGTGGGGASGISIDAFMTQMLGVFKRNGEWLCKFVIDGVGNATTEDIAEVQAVRSLERLGAEVLVEAFGWAGSVFEGYPSVTLSTFAISQGATFDGQTSSSAVLVTDSTGIEADITRWREDDRAIFGGWDGLIPGPWTEFGEYGEA